MPPTTSTLDLEAPTRPRYKMRLLQSEYMVGVSGNSGRFPAGSVLLADEETAFRWYDLGVAEPADADAETYGEVTRRNKREEFKRRAQAVEAGGVFDQAVTRDAFDGKNRQLMPPPMPAPRRGRPRRDDLAGAVINDTSDEDGV